MLTYEDARLTIQAADAGEFNLPTYSGAPTDLSYLKSWVLDQVTVIYGVAADIFDEATIYSTSILRDFVHRALYQTTTHELIDDIIATGDLIFPQNSDVATAFRYPAYGLCGLMAWQEYEVFRAFGYQTNEIATYNGTVSDFTDSHVTTEAYVSDVGDFIIQDATFNLLIEDNNGNPLSYDEVREVLYAGTGGLNFDSFNNYRSYFTLGTYETTTSGAVQSLMETQYFKVPYWFYGSDGALQSLTQYLFVNSTSAHDAGSQQGGTYATITDAVKAINFLEGSMWLSVADVIRDSGHYVSGFVLTDDNNSAISHWLTVRLDSGDYVSVDVDHGSVLLGSFDQLADEATGGPDLNPTANLSDFINPAYLLDYTGHLRDGYGLTPQSSQTFEFADVVLRNINTGAVKIWDAPDGGNLNNGVTLSPTSDTGYKIIGYGDYMGDDGGHDILFQKAATGQVGMWDDHANFRSLGTMTAAWRMVSQDDMSDFTGDGSDDILWHNSSTGAVGYWDILSGTNQGFTSLGSVSPTQWSVVATGDFNGDGRDDVLWKSNSTTEIREWLIGSDGNVAQNVGLWGAAGSEVIGAADITHDGSSDIIFRNSTTGEVGYFDILNGQNTGYHALGTIDLTWNVAAIRDITADGTPDIVWETPAGQLFLWNLDHAELTTHVATQYIGAHASDWIVA